MRNILAPFEDYICVVTSLNLERKYRDASVSIVSGDEVEDYQTIDDSFTLDLINGIGEQFYLTFEGPAEIISQLSTEVATGAYMVFYHPVKGYAQTISRNKISAKTAFIITFHVTLGEDPEKIHELMAIIH